MGKDGASGDLHPLCSLGFSQQHQSLWVNGGGASPVFQLNTLPLCDLGQVTQALCSSALLWYLFWSACWDRLMSLSVDTELAMAGNICHNQ